MNDIKRKKKNIFDSKLMTKLMAYFLVIIAVMFAISIYAVEYTKNYNSKVNSAISKMSEVQKISAIVSKMTNALEQYYNSPNDNTRFEFNKYSNEVVNLTEAMKKSHPNVYAYRDIDAIVQTITSDSIALIKDIDESALPVFYYRPRLTSITMLESYLYEQIHIAMDFELNEFQEYFSTSTNYTRNYSKLIYVVCVAVALLCGVFAFNFSRSIAKPLHSLSKSCSKIARGDLTVRGKTTKKVPTDEITVLVSSFNQMIETIESSMNQLKEKTEIEKQLKEEQIQNEKNIRLIKDAELKFLQMQINPHFLFNTFNSISALSQIEGAEMTTSMINSLSQILRYSLNEFDKDVTLQNEISLIENYLKIQKMRFQNRLYYKIEIPNELLQTKMPSMILQPLVENSIIHGIEPSANGGVVTISAKRIDNSINIMICDNGVGMNLETLETLRNLSDENEHDSTHGIGLVNVKKRLELIFGKGVLTFNSEPNVGTTITISIPI